MSKKSDQIKNALDRATNDRSGEVNAAAGRVQGILNNIREGSISGPQLNERQRISHDLDVTYREFQGTYANQSSTVLAEAKQLKSANTIRTAVFFALLALAVILLMSSWQTAFVLALIALIANPIARKMLTDKAENLSNTAQVPVYQALQVLGRPPHGTHPATGLAGQADNLYLSTLDQNALLLENQRRQMEAMQEQHEEQMAHQRQAMRRQQETMDRLVDEQQATNDALYGSPGIIGSAMRSYDSTKRKQQK